MLAVKEGKSKELLIKEACPGFSDGTYNASLWKHRKENLGGTSKFFGRIDNIELP